MSILIDKFKKEDIQITIKDGGKSLYKYGDEADIDLSSNGKTITITKKNGKDWPPHIKIEDTTGRIYRESFSRLPGMDEIKPYSCPTICKTLDPFGGCLPIHCPLK